MLDESNLDRFATLFSPATPPATPTLTNGPSAPPPPPTTTATRPRSSSTDSTSDFGAFVSVPPSQDPLSDVPPPTDLTPNVVVAPRPQNHSLCYFDQFTAHARTAAARNRREVLDELLAHQDDPMYMYFHEPDRRVLSPDPSTSTLSSTSEPASTSTPAPIPVSTPTDAALAEALATDLTMPPSPKLIRVEHGALPSPVLARVPVPPRLSGRGSPPSLSSSASSLPLSTSSESGSAPTTSASASASASTPSISASSISAPSTPQSPSAGHRDASATLSRLSSSLVSLLPARARTPTPSSTSSAPTPHAHTPHAHSHGLALTHGSPFASTPYIPPTGAPGFAGDRAWDRGFSDALVHDDPIDLGLDAPRPKHKKDRKDKTTRGVTLAGRREGTTPVLTEDMAYRLRPHLPPLLRLPRTWTLLYALDQHGISLNTLYARSEPRVPSRAHPNPPQGGLVVVRDAGGAVFGAWVGEGVKRERGGYYGSGEAFLWQYRDRERTTCEDGEEEEAQIEVFKWTGANAYVALCEPGFISFGGGDGHYGLYLDASLLDGSSAPCPTFGNPVLCTEPRTCGGAVTSASASAKREVSFECVGLEVWGIGSG